MGSPSPPAGPGSRSCGAVPVAAAALGADEPGEGVDGRTRVRMGIEAQPGGGAEAAPLAGEQSVAEQVRPYLQAVKPAFVARRGSVGLIGPGRRS